MSMFCYQCEQTAKGEGCTNFGVCGKDPETAALQDLLVHATKGIANYAHRARQLGATDGAVDNCVIDALFTTVTNVNFDPARMEQELRQAAAIKDKAKALYEEACRQQGKSPEGLNGYTSWTPADGLQGLLTQGEGIGIEKRVEALGQDLAGL